MTTLSSLSIRAASFWAAILLGLSLLPARAQTAFDTAIEIDGSLGKLISVPNFGAVAPTNEVTVEFWGLNTLVWESQAPFILVPDEDGNRFSGHLPTPEGTTYWDFGNSAAAGRLTMPTVPDINGKWIHYAFVATQSGNAMRVYTNGALAASKVGMTPFVRGDYFLRIGGDYNIDSYYFFGLIDEFRVWRVARTQAQIQSSRGTPLVGNEAGLLLYYRFDEDASSAVATNSATATGAAYNADLLGYHARYSGPISSPVVVTLAATGVTNNAAAVSGTVNPGGGATIGPTVPPATYFFQYGATTNYGNITAMGSIPYDDYGTTPVSATLSGLTLATLYHYRLFSSNSSGSSAGADLTFTTLVASPPVVATAPATAVTTNAATLNGSVYVGGVLTGYYFQYGTTTNYGSTTATSTLAAGYTNVTVANAIGSLSPGTLHHARLVGTNSAGTNRGGDITFTTLIVTAPVVTTQPATTVATNLTILNGTVNPHGANTACYFQYGTTTNYGSSTTASNLGAGFTTLVVSNTIGGLLTGTNYHFRVVATNTLGTNRGADLTFFYPTPSLSNVVLNADDDGLGSLRTAIAGTLPGGTVTFATNLSGQTITLTSGQLLVRSNLTIDASALSNRVTISGNMASRVLMTSNSATVVLKSLTFRDGLVGGGFGAGMFNSTNCTLTLSNCLLTANSADDCLFDDVDGGGGLYNAGTLTLAGCTLSGNSANGWDGLGGDASGGGLYNVGTLTLTECTVSSNFANGGSGGTSFPSSGGVGAGGGIYNVGRLTLNRNTFQGNVAIGGLGSDTYDGGAARGGGLHNAGSATLNQNTLGLNSSTGGRGGNGDAVSINPAGNGGFSQGGGIYNTGPLTLRQDTISSSTVRQGLAGTGGPAGATNGVAQGGGIFNTAIGTNCTLLNSLIARNFAPLLVGSATNSDVSGIFSSQGHNLVGATNGSTGFNASGDLKGTTTSPLNPLLGSLGPNGGATWTFAPQPNSPAFGAGDDSVTNLFATDQRGTGFPRRVFSHVDIGAYEVGLGFLPAITSVSAGSVTLDPTTFMGSVTVGASVNPNSLESPTAAWMQYGVSASYGIATAPLALGTGTSSKPASRSLTNLAPGLAWHYRWAASNFFGTSFSPDQIVIIGTLPGSGIPGDANGDGFVTQSELDAVYANYVTNSPWLYMTNAALVGGTNIIFSLSNSVPGAYSVEYTTNFSNWFNLGTATPRYLFTDTNAPANPKRYYRLRYP